MPISINPPRTLRQADLDQGHPLSQSLAMFVIPGNGAIDLESGKIPISQTGYGTVASPYGPAANFTTATSNGLNYGNYFCVPSNSTTYSIVVLAAPTSTARVSAPFVQYDQLGSGNTQIDFMFNATSAGSASAGAFAFLEYSSGNKATADSSAGAIDGKWHLFGVSRGISSGVSRLFLDGVQSGADGTSLSGSTQSGTPVMVCGGKNRDWATDYPVMFVAVWGRALSNTEHFALAANPWRMFYPFWRTAPKYGIAGAAIVGLQYVGAGGGGGSGGGVGVSYAGSAS